MKYDLLYVDPPWQYGNTSTKGAAENHYETMSVKELCAYREAPDAAAEDSALCMWVTYPTLPDAFTVASAWGFEYVTFLFTWIKTYPNGKVVTSGLGNYTRSNPESILLFRKGKGLKRIDTPDARRTQQVQFFRRLGHSAKPLEFYGLLDQIFGVGTSKIEFLSRGVWLDGWTHLGNEAAKSPSGLLDIHQKTRVKKVKRE